MTSRKHLHERLWAAAEQLRANGELKLNEISEPILGLIFLKFADDIEGDAFGEIYEYFLGEFARAEGAKGRKFYEKNSDVQAKYIYRIFAVHNTEWQGQGGDIFAWRNCLVDARQNC